MDTNLSFLLVDLQEEISIEFEALLINYSKLPLTHLLAYNGFSA
jgi:hypothetical protein